MAVDLNGELKERTEVKIQVDGVTENDSVIILNKGKDGWKTVQNVAGNGYVIGKFDHFSPVLVFVDKDGELEAATSVTTTAPVAVTPEITAPASTGDSANIVSIGLTMICAAFMLFVAKKRHNNN